MRVFISTAPFGEVDRKPLDLLEENNIEYVVNEYGRRLTEEELKDVIGDFDAVIAGTEPITKAVLDSGNRLRLISRVGIGLDNVDLESAKANGVKVSYTPDAPSPAVAELTIGLMLS